MASNRDYMPGDRFTITFTTAAHMEGLWHHCGSFDNISAGKTAYEALIASDIAEGEGQGQSLIGCRWRLTRERGSEVMETVFDRVFGATGLIDLATPATVTT